MLQKSTLQFLKKLEINNNKSWFDANKKLYDSAKEDFLQFTQALIKSIAVFDPPISDLDPKKCTFRINRDVRFSKDKSPYKNNMGASMNHGGKKIMKAGYYFHLQPNNKSFMAVGIYMPEAADLAKVRQEIDYSLSAFKKIVQEKNFVQAFQGLSNNEGMALLRPPKGYEADNPAIEFLKYKSYIASANISDKDLTDTQLLKKTVAKFKAGFPLNRFINTAIGG